MGINVDNDKFWENYRQGFHSIGETLNQLEVDAVSLFLTSFRADERLQDFRWAAYILVTARWEQDRFTAPRERGGEVYLRYLLGKLGNSPAPSKHHHVLYRGGGPCHVTGLDNYRLVDSKLGLAGRLIKSPELITEPSIAYETAIRGHIEGWFSGGKHTLPMYFNDVKEDPREARRIINGGEFNIAKTALGLKPAQRGKRHNQCVEAIASQEAWYRVIKQAITAAM